MPTPAELIRVLLLPLVVSTTLATVGRWRKWPWAMPVAVGVGFLAGYAAISVPKLPPADGTDWLFWLVPPLVLVGVIDAVVGKLWGWLLGLAAGGVAWAIARPLVTADAVPAGQAMTLAAAFAAAGVVIAFVGRIAEKRSGAWAVGVALAVVVGGAGVVVMSSNVRVVGLYGLAAAAAVGPAGVLGRRGWHGVPVVAAGLLAGVLTGGRLYADPGVTTLNLTVLSTAPLLLLVPAFVPLVPRAVRGVVGVLLVALAVAAVAGPTATAAKRAAEEDPYAAR